MFDKAALALAAGASAAVLATPSTGALGALGLAKTRRVDLLIIGDSNEQYNGWGWQAGFQIALGAKYGLYATPIYPQEIGGTVLSVAGAPHFGGIANGAGAITGAPAAHSPFALPFTNYLYQVSGAIGQFNGITIVPNATDAYGNTTTAFNTQSNLRCHYSYGTFASGGGTWTPASRLENSPYTTLTTGSSVNAQTGVDGQAIAHLDLSAASRIVPFSFRWQLPGGTASVGKNTQFWSRVEDLNQQAGVSVNTFLGLPGQSLWGMATALLGYSTSQMSNYLSAVTYLQAQAGAEPIVVVLINSGDNDRNETHSPTLGPLPSTAPTSFQAYLDNLREIYNLMTTAWSAAGLPANGLYFMVMPSHPVSSPDDANIITYRAACQRFAAGKSNVSCVDLSSLITYAEIVANGGYNSNPHLSNIAYQYVATKMVGSLIK